MWWLLIAFPTGASYGLSQLAHPDTLGAVMPLVLGAVVMLGVCWRVLERLLWLRYRTKKEHTVAARGTCIVVCGLLMVQAVFVMIGE
ncbi:MAG: hypothetical protein H7210_02020 [Pyrinomonadaceae bacterium]|nr:hypothetical protein [Phycisphaerales bacterium]